jgi:hypothetical protein
MDNQDKLEKVCTQDEDNQNTKTQTDVFLIISGRL